MGESKILLKQTAFDERKALSSNAVLLFSRKVLVDLSYNQKKHPARCTKPTNRVFKKGRISIQKFLFRDTNSMTRFRKSIHPHPYILFFSAHRSSQLYFFNHPRFPVAFFASFRYNRYVLSCIFYFIFFFKKDNLFLFHSKPVHSL